MGTNTKSVSIWLPGNPCLKSNKRPPTGPVQFSKKGNPYMQTFNPCAAWERAAKGHAMAQLNQQGIKIPAFPHQMLMFRMIVFADDVTKQPGMSRTQPRGDNPNYYKSICDAMNRVLYKDDSQIMYTAHALLVRSMVRDLAGEPDAWDGWNKWTIGGGTIINVEPIDLSKPWALLNMEVPQAVRT